MPEIRYYAPEPIEPDIVGYDKNGNPVWSDDVYYGETLAEMQVVVSDCLELFEEDDFSIPF